MAYILIDIENDWAAVARFLYRGHPRTSDYMSVVFTRRDNTCNPLPGPTHRIVYLESNEVIDVHGTTPLHPDGVEMLHQLKERL